jgi:hypothetical protein
MEAIEGMLQEGRIPLTPEEDAAVETLIAESGGKSVSFTREGDGLIVHVGDDTYGVDAAGVTAKQAV